MNGEVFPVEGKVITEGEFISHLEKLLKGAKKRVYFASAWVKGGIFRRLVGHIPPDVEEVRLIVRGSEKTDFEITDPGVFDIDRVSYAFHPSLHAKMVIVDDDFAMIGSANLTYAGLGEGGNREVAIFVEGKEAVSKLLDYFDTLWKESYEYTPNLVGILMNPSRSSRLEVLLLRSSWDIPEGTLVTIPWQTDDGMVKIIGSVDEVIAYNTGFFMNPFGGDSSALFPSASEITFVNDENKPHPWRVGALFSYVEKSSNFYLARIKVLGVYDGERLSPLFAAPPIGLPVYKDDEDTLSHMLMKDMGGRDMRIPIPVGKLYGSDTNIHIDASYLLQKDRARHMAVLGTTGSGKSFFAQRILIPGIVREVKKRGLFKNWFKVIVIDPHGEWASALGDEGISVREIVLDELNVPLSYDENVWKEYLERYGVIIGGNSSLGKTNKGILKNSLAKYRDISEYSNFLRNMIENVIPTLQGDFEEYDLKEDLNAAADKIDDVFRKPLYDNDNFDVIVFNLSNLLDSDIKTSVSGMIAGLLFERMRKMKNDRDVSSLLVVEEAHNFAPEKGYGDVKASKDNQSLVAISKIAAEGRKFGLGLLIITQRPASVNKYVLSQMGTYAIFRLVNRNDLDATVSAVEYAGSDVLVKLPSLRTGMALLSGLSLPFPVFVDMRKEEGESV